MKVYFDEVEIGTRLPNILLPPISKQQVAQFASLIDDFSPLYLDDEFASKAGFTCAFLPNSFSANLCFLMISKFAQNIRVASMSSTFIRLVRPSDRLKTYGLLVRRYNKNEENRVKLSLWVENQNNEVVMKGNAICLLFKNQNEEKQTRSSIPKGSKISKDALFAKCHALMQKVENKKIKTFQKEHVENVK